VRARKTEALFIFLILFSCNVNLGFSQSSEAASEKKESIAEFRKAQVEPSNLQIAYRASGFCGYDSNVLLAPDSKGDIFEELLFSLNFKKQLGEGLRLTFDYDLDNINYNELIHASNLINHFRVALHKTLSFLTIGSGYDLAFFYYPHGEDQDFLFQKGIFYLRHDISDQAYQQLQFEAGQKDYIRKNALSDTIESFQSKEQRDKRLGIEYSIGSIVRPRLFVKLKAKFYQNDSNARYQNFYDYQAYEISPFAKYRLISKLDMYSSFTYIQKDYKSRLVTLGNVKEEDSLYGVSLGFSYRCDNKNTIFLSYAYRNNSSNDPLAKYTDNMISCGWQHNF
jgi:hypothetical protein